MATGDEQHPTCCTNPNHILLMETAEVVDHGAGALYVVGTCATCLDHRRKGFCLSPTKAAHVMAQYMAGMNISISA